MITRVKFLSNQIFCNFQIKSDRSAGFVIKGRIDPALYLCSHMELLNKQVLTHEVALNNFNLNSQGSFGSYFKS